MRHMAKSLALVVAVLLCTVAVALAQTAPPASAAAPAPPSGLQAPEPASTVPDEKLIDGPVKGVDSMASTVRVGWFLGLLSTTLEVTPGTRIAVEGATASLQDIREGDRVKAAYETQEGRNVAKSIEVTQADAPRRLNTPGAASGSSAPPMGPPQGSAEPPAGGSKAY